MDDTGEPSRAELIRATQDKLHIFDALVRVLDDPHGFLDVLLDAADLEDAVAALRRRFGLEGVQPYAVLDMQFRRVTGAQRETIREQHAQLTAELAALRASG